jgi:hypothetical protein
VADWAADAREVTYICEAMNRLIENAIVIVALAIWCQVRIDLSPSSMFHSEAAEGAIRSCLREKSASGADDLFAVPGVVASARSNKLRELNYERIDLYRRPRRRDRCRAVVLRPALIRRMPSGAQRRCRASLLRRFIYPAA